MLFVPPSMPFMVPEAEAATTHTIEMTETGFSQTTITIDAGDSIRFLNTHVNPNDPEGSVEPHCISEPASIAATHLSCILLSDSTISHTFSSDKINFGNPGTEEFHDSYYWYGDPDDAVPLLVTILAPDTTPPTVTASAYVDATSSTGRTLTLVGDNIPTSCTFSEYHCNFAGGEIGGMLVQLFSGGIGAPYHWTNIWLQNEYQMQIPADWEAGTYSIVWYYEGGTGGEFHPVTGATLDSPSSTTVTIPALPSADTTPPVNLSFESLNITGTSDVDGPSIIVVVGESWHVTPTLAWEGTLPDSFPTGEPVIHGEIKFPDGTVYESINWSGIFDNSANSVDYDAKTITLSTWNGQFYTNTDWPIGGYLVTITADTGNVLSETNESDNVIERLDLWTSCNVYVPVGDVCVADVADTTPPTVTASAYVNATSSTDRTLTLVGDNIPTSCTLSEYHCNFAGGEISGMHVTLFSGLIGAPYHWTNIWLQNEYQMQIPADWEAGTYNIIWYYEGGTAGEFHPVTGATLDSPSSTTVTIPSISGHLLFPPQNYDVIASYDGGAWWQSDYFTPKLLKINTGDNVTWKHDPNSYYGYSRIIGSFIGGYQLIDAQDGLTYTHTFDQPGTYVYTEHVIGACQNYNPDPTTCPIGTIIVDAQPGVVAPVVNVPSNISLSTPDSSGRTATFSVSASDNVGVTSGPTCSPSSGSQFPIGTTTVTCFATGSVGNLGSGTFTVTVTHSMALPTVIANYYGVNNASDYFTPSTLTVNVGDTVTWLHNPNSQHGYTRIYGSFTGGYHYIGDNYVTFDHTFNSPGTYVYTDHVFGACQTYTPNPSTCPVGTVIVVESGAPPPPEGPSSDTSPPTFPNFPEVYGSYNWPQYWYASNSTGYNVSFSPNVSDNVGVTSGPTCSPSSGFLFPIGTTTVTCTASDAAGNVGTVSFTVTVSLEAPPATTQFTTVISLNSSGKVVCIGFQNLPAGTQGYALHGPPGPGLTNIYENGAFRGHSGNITNLDDKPQATCTTVDWLSGEYKWAALSEPVEGPNSSNIIEFSIPINYSSPTDDTTPLESVSSVLTRIDMPVGSFT